MSHKPERKNTQLQSKSCTCWLQPWGTAFTLKANFFLQLHYHSECVTSILRQVCIFPASCRKMQISVSEQNNAKEAFSHLVREYMFFLATSGCQMVMHQTTLCNRHFILCHYTVTLIEMADN